MSDRASLSVEGRWTLQRLWRRRQHLTLDDVQLGYRLALRALAHGAEREVAVLGEPRHDLIDEFVYLRTLRLGAERQVDEGKWGPNIDGEPAVEDASQPDVSFREYLIDRLRSAAQDQGDAGACETVEEMAGVESAHEHEDKLEKCQLDEAQVALQTRDFLRDLSETECLLIGAALGSVLDGRARYGVASAHRLAGRLGIVHAGSALPTDFAKTRIGRWIESVLEIPVADANRAAIDAIFQVLGREASRSSL